MIQQACFEKQWIEDFRRAPAYRRINPPLLEKMIHALSLLQHLSKQPLRFVFKGGTSLVLLLDQPNRFSVDIDIMTMSSRAEIEAALDGVVANSHFKSWTLDEVRSYKPGIPKAHYELSFASHYNFEVSYILLDVLYGQHQYPETTLLPITSTWVSTLDLVQVQMPTIDAITGDKLTAFAPNTTGIKYGVGKEQEIVKQLFDLGHLFDKMDSLAVVGQSFRAFAAQEIQYRQLPIDADAVLQDIVATCRTLALRERNVTQPDLGNFQELQTGVKRFGNFVITGTFHLDEAIAAAGKVALLATALLLNGETAIEKYAKQDVQAISISSGEWNFLNKLKKMPDKAAFFYWQQAVGLMEAATSVG
jgi:hypothetical protein